MWGRILTAWSPEKIFEELGVPWHNIDCGGIKLCLDKVFRFRDQGVLSRDEKILPDIEEVKENNGFYYLEPGAYRIRYREKIIIPDNAIGLAIPRSSLLRMGASIFTAVWDPGYMGRGEGLLVVYNPYGIVVEKGSQIAQLVLISLDRKTKKLYRGTYYRENIDEQKHI